MGYSIFTVDDNKEKKMTKLIQILDFIAANPGCTRPQVQKAFGITGRMYLDSWKGYVTNNHHRAYSQMWNKDGTVEVFAWTKLPVYIEKRRTGKVQTYFLTELGFDKLNAG